MIRHFAVRPHPRNYDNRFTCEKSVSDRSCPVVCDDNICEAQVLEQRVTREEIEVTIVARPVPCVAHLGKDVGLQFTSLKQFINGCEESIKTSAMGAC